MTIRDDSDRHNLYLQKLAAGIYNTQVYPSLEAARKAARLLLLDAEEITSVRELRRIQTAIDKEVAPLYAAGWSEASDELAALALYEASWQVDAISQYSDKKLRVPARKQVESFIDKAVMSLHSGKRVYSGVWSEFVSANIDNLAQQYNGLVVNGYQNGLTVNQIARSIKQSTDGVLANSAQTLARTGTAHYTNTARDAMADQNKDIIIGRVFSATFDNRTTLICRSLDGKFYAQGEKHPVLPLHYGERSSYYFVTDKSEIGQGRKAAVGGNDADEINPRRKLKYRGKKDQDIFDPGSIKASTTQDAWLRKQPDWFIESALDSKIKAKLFKDGNMSIDKFIDMQGRPISIARLRELDAEAFKRAGL